MADGRPSSRKKILAAAAELATESGPGSLSLDAVASRAGVSKGGLLYNFPTKAKLMQGLVENYLDEFEKALDAATKPAQGKGESLLAAYIRLSEMECGVTQPSASWIFSAMAEDPDFLAPIIAFKRRLFERLKADTPDLSTLLMSYLAIEGLRSMKLFGSDILTEKERRLVHASLLAHIESDRNKARPKHKLTAS